MKAAIKLGVLLLTLCTFMGAQNAYHGGIKPPTDGSVFTPRLVPNTTLPTSTGTVWTVTTAAQLTTRLATGATACGDVIEIPHGTNLVGQFVAGIPSGVCDDTHYVIIRSDNWTLLPPRGTRVNTSTDVANMAKITGNAVPYTILFDNSSKYYWMLGIEVTTQTSGNIDLVRIGDTNTMTLPSQCADHVVVDRSYIHGAGPIFQGFDVHRGVSTNGTYLTLIDSVVKEIHQENNETWAVGGWQCTGPWLFRNNTLESEGENVFVGGSDPPRSDMYPADITIDHNYVYKDFTNWSYQAATTGTDGGVTNAWTLTGAGGAVTYSVNDKYAFIPGSSNTITNPTLTVNGIGAKTIKNSDGSALGVGYMQAGVSTIVIYDGVNWRLHYSQAKNLFEVKFCIRCEIYGNVFENSYAGAQVGFCILASARSNNSSGIFQKAAVVQDFYFHDNIVTGCAFAFRYTGADSNDPADPKPIMQTRVRAENNLFRVNGPPYGQGGGTVFVSTASPNDISAEHNTLFADETQNGSTLMPDVPGALIKTNNLVWKNNLSNFGVGGVKGSGFSNGKPSLDGYFTNYVWTKNIVYSAPSCSAYNNTGAGIQMDTFCPANAAAVGFTDATNCIGGTLSVAACKLTVGSAYHNAATDGTDIGVNIDRLLAYTNGVKQ